jgi:hypothetical protein
MNCYVIRGDVPASIRRIVEMRLDRSEEWDDGEFRTNMTATEWRCGAPVRGCTGVGELGELVQVVGSAPAANM